MEVVLFVVVFFFELMYSLWFFFFSSRRRHTRWTGDWSSDVCSSDLPWLQTLTDGFVANVHEGVPVWQLLVHVVNHGTQHRAEAAALLTAEGRSPGELDLFDYAEEQADADG